RRTNQPVLVRAGKRGIAAGVRAAVSQEPQSLGVFPEPAAVLPQACNMVGDEREAGGDAQAQAGNIDQGFCGRPAYRVYAAAQEKLGAERHESSQAADIVTSHPRRPGWVLDLYYTKRKRKSLCLTFSL